MIVARDLAALRQARARLPRTLALVPTMGALHAGHLALVAAARVAAGHVAASIFVNPLQFTAAADLARYPRTEEEDLAALEAAGCDLAWVPDAEAMYAPDRAATVDVAGPAEGFEGAARPGHFRGVATVCTKLFLQCRADVAVFGEKDWQQLQVIRRVVRDLDIPIAILPVPTVREEDGLALSSRNRFLTREERALAPMLAREGFAAAEALAAGGPAETTLAPARARLAEAGFGVEYLALVEAGTMRPLGRRGDAPARLVAAARLGSVRLLDNWAIPGQ
ncbi:pantoate--beta-alanine ligase [Elioraea rosea]|uniref:pantoate--beta-alanine ligase n=1 Tax=Elioraea rosea TaxID=2492390 RepID=UPI001182ED57|nr:pantoate--beta-alanine ligase [Elioraea rosea]